MAKSLLIILIEQTCQACPAQWEGWAYYNRDDARDEISTRRKPVYIRYRWGYLSICIGSEGGTISSAVDGEEVLGKVIDQGGLDGHMTTEELKKYCAEEVKFL